MLYLHDVWVNWFEGEENGYNVCHFYEWRKDDTIELLDQVPLLKVDGTLYHYIENEFFVFVQKMLEDVMNVCSKSIALLLQMEKELLRLTQLVTMYQFAKVDLYHVKSRWYMRW